MKIFRLQPYQLLLIGVIVVPVLVVCAFVPTIAVQSYQAIDYRVSSVERKPAIDAGFQPGDLILRADGAPVDDWKVFINALVSHANQPLTVTIKRSGRVKNLVVVPDKQGIGITYGFRVVGSMHKETVFRVLMERLQP